MDAHQSLARPVRHVAPGASATGRNVDHFVPRRQRVREEVDAEVLPTSVREKTVAVPMDIAVVAVRMGLLRCEWRASGSGVLRFLEDILHPTRLDNEQVAESIRRGLVSRWVPRNVSEQVLLAPDLRARVRLAYERSRRSTCLATDDLVVMALGCQAWDDFDHIMRKHLPVDERAFHHVLPQLDWLEEVLVPSEFRWDTRLVGEGAHCRVHASNEACCIHVVWECTSSDEAAAALRASLHPNRTCRLIEMGTQRVRVLRTTAQLSSAEC
jgi:hypothetical protein